MSKTSAYAAEHPFDKRKEESSKIRTKYPDRIPVICEKQAKSQAPDIDKKKYLVPANMKVAEFMEVIRKRIKTTATESIFLFVNNTLPSQVQYMSQLYEEHQDKDGFLYVTYSEESTFGY